jgi:phage terminase Nu1 subunit (DNA packaging protein)
VAERLTYPVTTIAKLLDLTDRRVQQLANDGVIPRAERGRYDLIATVQGYVRFLRERAFGAVANTDSHTEKTRLTAAQANIAEMTEMEMRGELVRAGDVRREIYTASRQIRNTMLTMPDRIASKLVTVDDGLVIHEMLEAEVTVMLEDVAALGDQIEENQQEEVAA